MTEAGLQEVETYVYCFHNPVVKYIMTRTIMDLCLAAELRPVRSGEKEGLQLVGMWKATWEAKREERDGKADGLNTETEYYVGGYCSNHYTLVTYHNAPLSYDVSLELHRSTMSMGTWGTFR